jgi:DNA-binding transcriptional regulator YhcF (GntR family)
MLLQLDFSSDVPIYKQIRDQFVLGIAGGLLCAGEKLPTIRALANETGVNAMTINKAYQLLKQEGYITADRRGGTVIAGQIPEVSAEKTLAGLRLPSANAILAGMSRETWLELCGQAYDNLKKEKRQ